MNTSLLLPATVFVVLAATGCQKVEPPKPDAPTGGAGIAVIDLDEVARQLGSDKQIAESIKQRQATLNSKLANMAKAYTAEFEKQKEAFETEAQEGSVQLASYQKQVNQSFNNARTQAQQNLSQHRKGLIKQFRDAVRPAARKIAAKRGLTIIVTKQDSLLYDYSDEYDITGEVVEVLRASSARQATTSAGAAEEQG